MSFPPLWDGYSLSPSEASCEDWPSREGLPGSVAAYPDPSAEACYSRGKTSRRDQVRLGAYGA
jgi:hypothetical protein